MLRLVLAATAALLFASAPASAAKVAPLNDPASLNIGFVCRWQAQCVERQRAAMVRALRFVSARRPAAAKVQLCNRNASRRGRVDWIGFDNCIRNSRLKATRRR